MMIWIWSNNEKKKNIKNINLLYDFAIASFKNQLVFSFNFVYLDMFFYIDMIHRWYPKYLHIHTYTALSLFYVYYYSYKGKISLCIWL